VNDLNLGMHPSYFTLENYTYHRKEEGWVRVDEGEKQRTHEEKGRRKNSFEGEKK
jgi:hypothetical protein